MTNAVKSMETTARSAGSRPLKNRAVGDFSLPPGTLCINQIVVHDFSCPIPDTVHPLYPQHLILSFKLFGDTLTLGHLLYQLKKHMRCEIMIL